MSDPSCLWISLERNIWQSFGAHLLRVKRQRAIGAPRVQFVPVTLRLQKGGGSVSLAVW